jgi:hypothetical protein
MFIMRKKNTTFVDMATDQTNTYQDAKLVFNSLGLKEDTSIHISEEHIPLFRKHLSEMIKRQKSNNRYATRFTGNKLTIIRIQ